MRDAIGLIVNERERQISEKHWSHEHDDGHDNGSLAVAAAFYACPPKDREHYTYWPFDDTPEPGDRVRELTKAGALIVAEMERIMRRQEVE